MVENSTKIHQRLLARKARRSLKWIYEFECPFVGMATLMLSEKSNGIVSESDTIPLEFKVVIPTNGHYNV